MSNSIAAPIRDSAAISAHRISIAPAEAVDAVVEGGGVSQAVGLGAGVASATFVMLWSVTHNVVSASFTFKA